MFPSYPSAYNYGCKVCSDAFISCHGQCMLLCEQSATRGTVKQAALFPATSSSMTSHVTVKPLRRVVDLDELIATTGSVSETERALPHIRTVGLLPNVLVKQYRLQ